MLMEVFAQEKRSCFIASLGVHNRAEQRNVHRYAGGCFAELADVAPWWALENLGQPGFGRSCLGFSHTNPLSRQASRFPARLNGVR